MFCTKCGSEYPEGGICPKCNPTITDVCNFEKDLRKGKYLSKVASPTVKGFSITGIITTFLCVALLIASYFSFVKKDLFDVPALSYADSLKIAGYSADDVDELRAEFKKYSDDIDELIIEGDFTNDEEKRLKKLKKEIENFDSDSISINKLTTLIDEFNDVIDEEKITELEENDIGIKEVVDQMDK